MWLIIVLTFKYGRSIIYSISFLQSVLSTNISATDISLFQRIVKGYGINSKASISLEKTTYIFFHSRIARVS